MQTIAIIGAGELGRRWAYRSLRAGYRTILEDVSISALEQGIAAIRGLLEADDARDGRGPAAGTRGASSPAERAIGRLTTAHAVEEAVRDADLIIETVPDELEMKLELFTVFDKFAKPGALLASTTNIVSITDLAEMTFCPERCVGLRFACYAGAEQLEITKGFWTSEETVARCRGVALRMGLEIRFAPDVQAFSAGGTA